MLPAALAYFAVAFAAGFILGTARVLGLAPRLGELPAVVIEAPVMIGVSWLAARWCVRIFRVPDALGARAAMGAVAFALLQTAEFALATLAFGRSASEILAGFATPAGAVGLTAQVLFALLPLATPRRGAPGES